MHADRSRLSRDYRSPFVLKMSEALCFFSAISTVIALLLVWHAVWVAVVFLLMILGAAIQLWWRQKRQALWRARSPTAPPLGRPPSDTAQYWTDWLAGWYWQTDAQYRLVLLKPPADSPAQWWLQAQELVDRGSELWAVCHQSSADQAAADSPHQAMLAMLQAQMRSGGQVLVSDMPWPWLQDANASRLVGQPRWDALGALLGHHGVWVPELRQGIREMPLTLVEPPREPRRTEEEINQATQESLRFALSHDLRAPLRVVDGFARILKEDYGPQMDRIGKDHLERIVAATVRMNGMIDAVLDQAKLSQAPLQLACVDLSAMVADVATEMLVGMQGAGGAVPVLRPQVLVAEGLSHLADELLLRRVLENLIGNALKYSAKVAQARIEFGAIPATNPTVFFVKDNGAGFDMKHADKLFGLFQRLHSAREFQGTGVGLASVHNIVRRHSGRVWAEGAPGEGACFYFTLASFGSAGAHPGTHSESTQA